MATINPDKKPVFVLTYNEQDLWCKNYPENIFKQKFSDYQFIILDNGKQEKIHEWCKQTYQNLLNACVAPEMARMILPQSMYTEWYWSGTLYAFARVCNLRCKPDAQKETQMVADQIDVLAKELFPNSWEALRDV